MSFKVHFLNVGDGDCTLVELPDNTLTVIDIRNGRTKKVESNSKFENPISYIKDLQYTSIYRYIQTHPDMDHMDGIYDLSQIGIVNFWDTDNSRKKPEDFTQGFREIDWDEYVTLKKKAKYRTRSLTPIGLEGGKFPYEIYILHPTDEIVKEANKAEDWNYLSYVVLVMYKGFKLLISGDTSDKAWEYIYEWTQENSDGNKLLSGITVFKAAHHGRNSSYCGIDMLNLMNPQKIVISKGSVPGEQSAYGKYYSWAGGPDNMYLTSKGTILVDYYDTKNRKYSINYK